ncbi:MAG: site-2 protease family protein [Pseudomonadota bacterium]
MFRDTTPIFEFYAPRALGGMPVQITQSWFMLLGLLLLLFMDGPDPVYSVIYITVLLGSILLHELGHAWGAHIQGIPVKRVVLHGAGGFCQATRSTSAYEDELYVGMGPIVTIALWAISGLLIWTPVPYEVYEVLWAINYINGFLALFNLLPVMPLDGGRIFHLILRRLFPSQTAARIAGGVGLFLALAWLPLMAVAFTYMGFILLFFPPIAVHWQMLRGATA